MAKASNGLENLPLPEGVSEDYVDCTSTVGLKFHILKSGYDSQHSKPLILLLHGFPELAYSWRKVMPRLASAGYCVVAPDNRGYGRTTGWDDSDYHNVDLSTFSMTAVARDNVALVSALGYHAVRCVIGHDFGAVVASMCALMRPDLFQSCILMSHPFKGAPSLPFDILSNPPTTAASASSSSKDDIHAALAALDPPRKHYKWYNATPPAASDWDNPPQGLPAFLRGYFHLKSADWAGNGSPKPLAAWTAAELARLPPYYVMPAGASMPEAVADAMHDEDDVAVAEKSARWLPDDDLAVYSREWGRTGFQGGLNFYRVATDAARMRDVLLFAGARVAVPLAFVSGAEDWGNYQEPGALEGMSAVCRDFRGTTFIEGASHWVQQERPEEVVDSVLDFLRQLDREALS